MKNHWIFVSFEYNDYSIGSIKTVLRRIKRTGKWYIGPYTPHRHELRKGDRVIIYQAGKEGKKFIGCATLQSELKVNKEEPFGFVILSNVTIWEKPVEIWSVLDKLSFVKNKRRWGSYFQGGVKRLPKNDYLRIMTAARDRKSLPNR